MHRASGSQAAGLLSPEGPGARLWIQAELPAGGRPRVQHPLQDSGRGSAPLPLAASTLPSSLQSSGTPATAALPLLEP